MPALAPSSALLTDRLSGWLLIGAIVLLVSVAAVRLANTWGVPTLLLYLAIGIALGESGLGIKFDDPAIAQVLGYSALILILTEGGLTTSWSAIRPSVAPAALLSTLGVLVSVVVVGVSVHFLLGLSWNVSMLLGAVVSSTDVAAVFSVLRVVPLPARLRGMLEAESGFNDAPVVLLVVALAEQAAPSGPHHSWLFVFGEAAFELIGGALIGLALGYLLGRLLRTSSPGSSGLFSIAVVGVAVLAYAAADAVHTSGFIATYVCALVLGNLHLPHRAAVRGFGQAVGWLAQIGLFVMLGLLASPDRLLDQLGPALVVGLVLLLLARPLSVLATMSWFRMPLREQAFLSWAGLRGAVPVVLASVPFTLGTPDTEWILDLVFVLVVIFTLVQAPTLPWITRRLGIVESAPTLDVDIEATPLDQLDADVVQVSVGETSRLHGVEIFELRLPPGANVTLVVRDGEGFVPTMRTALRRGDSLLVVTTQKVRRQTIRRIRDVSREGRLAGWRPSVERPPAG
ncbi:potassium/proton antiporter [Luteipulveratus halotolerans]|uniref:Potassium transporter n=1 Tax=Luteipulveratus halotolerans TaxID=1631356 RepID=A0A0L6CKL7_9MICO|nr:potassium/proton antiporter [Luteipulveratus halotolerans]KNX38048.1 potassium transporter [Luteipulveratus halotolerans]